MLPLYSIPGTSYHTPYSHNLTSHPIPIQAPVTKELHHPRIPLHSPLPYTPLPHNPITNSHTNTTDHYHTITPHTHRSLPNTVSPPHIATPTTNHCFSVFPFHSQHHGPSSDSLELACSFLPQGGSRFSSLICAPVCSWILAQP